VLTPTSPLKVPHIKVVGYFEDEILVEFPQEILGDFTIVTWWIVKNHIPLIPKIIPNHLVMEPIDRKPLGIKVKSFMFVRVNE
jgi:hypothetical protein